MGEDPQPPDEADPAQGGVFGKLPDTRAGSRSPRRDAARAGRRSAAKPRTAAAAKPRTSAAAAESRGARATKPGGPKARPVDPAAGREAAGTPEAGAEPAGSDAGSGRGLEDVAWAGIAAAAEAATVGVRLAGRAFEALRETVERR